MTMSAPLTLPVLALALSTLSAAPRQASACSSSERREALREMQAAVLKVAPLSIPSMADAVAPGGALAGWRLSHGYVVLDDAGAIVLDNLAAVAPMPPLLFYAPSDASTAADWRDFDGPDDPYRLEGWSYVQPYTPGSNPPRLPCITADEWVVHEAGWHLKDGNMRLTPGATAEPPRPPGLDALMWHPRIWDLHVWRGTDGTAQVFFRNPNERRGGLKLPDGSFFRIHDVAGTGLP
jgi:hypothetical protein